MSPIRFLRIFDGGIVSAKFTAAFSCSTGEEGM
jgi:hypothetical protein